VTSPPRLTPSTTNALRVLVVADDPLARAGLAALLAEQSDLQVVGQIERTELGNGDETLATYQPDVLLWDLGWELVDALELLSELTPTPPSDTDALAYEPPIVALLADPEDAVAAWRAGARGLLPRDADAAQIAAALTGASLDLLVVDPAFAGALSAHGSDEQPLVEPLTPRELEVLQLLAEGLPNKTIARNLEISEHTVKFHVNAILSKLNAGSRTEAVVRATRAGLILL
jgi:DNA-binding NarL/FixJ family response regulator